MFQVVELMFQDVELVLQDVEHKFQDVEDRIPLGGETFFTPYRSIFFRVICFFFKNKWIIFAKQKINNYLCPRKSEKQIV